MTSLAQLLKSITQPALVVVVGVTLLAGSVGLMPPADLLPSSGASGSRASRSSALPIGTAAAQKPNIVLIVADDLGYGELSTYNKRVVQSPNIDQIGKDGVRCTNGYVTAPVCCPSRTGLLTGRYQQRFGFEFNIDGVTCVPPTKFPGIPVTETILPAYLKQAGYATGMVGKWHLGFQPEMHPVAKGFDEFNGFLHGSNLYIDPASEPGVETIMHLGEQRTIEQWVEMNKKGERPMYNGTEKIAYPTQYLTDYFGDKAVSFIDKHQKEPFFLYLAFSAPHDPLIATKKYYDRYPNVKDRGQRILAAMISAMDDNVGRVLAKLKEAKISDNTIVIFMSDNGCATYTGACTSDTLNGGKLTHFEGGFRVPFVMRFPNGLPQGLTYNNPISALDVVPTLAAAAGITLPTDRVFDGVNLAPYLRGKNNGMPHDVLCWRNAYFKTIRKGNWKLYVSEDPGTDVINPGSDKAAPQMRGVKQNFVYLFDLSKDAAERTNLAEKNPQIVDDLRKTYLQWEAQMEAPRWNSRWSIYQVFNGKPYKLPV